MAALITVVGNSGVGKSTLTRLLAQKAGLMTGLEQHQERPFQKAFKQTAHQALANQVDYFLLRAEQEVVIRNGTQAGILDGGLEMDFHVFSHLFHQKGYLSGQELDLLRRLYATLRQHLPDPDVYIHLTARVETIARRFLERDRELEIATLEDLPLLEALLERWLENVPERKVIRVKVDDEPADHRLILPILIEKIKPYLEAR